WKIVPTVVDVILMPESRVCSRFLNVLADTARPLFGFFREQSNVVFLFASKRIQTKEFQCSICAFRQSSQEIWNLYQRVLATCAFFANLHEFGQPVVCIFSAFSNYRVRTSAGFGNIRVLIQTSQY